MTSDEVKTFWNSSEILRLELADELLEPFGVSLLLGMAGFFSVMT